MSCGTSSHRALALGNTAVEVRAVALALYLSRGARPCRAVLDALAAARTDDLPTLGGAGDAHTNVDDPIAADDIVAEFVRVFGTVPERVALLVEHSHDGLEAYHRMRVAVLGDGALEPVVSELTLMAVNAAEHRSDFAAVHARGAAASRSDRGTTGRGRPLFSSLWRSRRLALGRRGDHYDPCSIPIRHASLLPLPLRGRSPMATDTGYTLQSDAPHTFVEWIRERAAVGGAKVALDICGEQRTYQEIDGITDRIGAGLRTLDLAEGEHVSLMMANSIENVESWFGLAKAGLVEVPIHTASRGAGPRVHHPPCRLTGDHHRCRVSSRTSTRSPSNLPNLQHVIVNGPLDAAA